MRTKENGPDSMGRPYFSKFRSTWLGLGQTLDLPEKMSFSFSKQRRDSFQETSGDISYFLL